MIDAATGEFVEVFEAEAHRLYAADIAGDYREEIVILEVGDPGRLRIFWNGAANDRDKARPWSKNRYRRRKQNWNYFSP